MDEFTVWLADMGGPVTVRADHAQIEDGQLVFRVIAPVPAYPQATKIVECFGRGAWVRWRLDGPAE